MPRIDPLQLLKCLGVLLTPSGGIRSNEEVQRLASLMMKFSKKLVSKCVYILILKNTEPNLLGLFMSAGGWTLVLTWLSDGISGKNWALVTELLELLLMCPVDVERLKSNSIPRLVKGLSKDESLGQVNILASRLVEQWLKIVKDETVSPDITSTVVIVNQDNIVVEEIPHDNETPGLVEEITLKVDQGLDDSQVITPQQFYKVTVRDGKQVIAKVDSVVSDSAIERTEQSSDNMTLADDTMTVNNVEALVEVTDEIKDKKKEDSDKKSSSSSSSSSKDKDRDKSRHDRSKHRSSSSSKSSSSKSSSSKDKHSSSSSSSSRDKNKDKDRDRTKDRDKHKHRSNGSVKHSSSSSSGGSSNSSSTNKDNKEKQAEKDKDTLAKIQPKSVDKLGRIPKKSSSSSSSDKKSDKKSSESSEHRTKPSISIEVRKKDSGDRPKTVKVFNSKLRSTGLEEAPKPPPPRSTPKKPATLPNLPVKRPSPSREAPPPPEKRIKLPETETQEKPGGIKLIPPKPKPAFLQESNMFMDALASSATNKKEPKKRKRRTSVTKDTPTTPTTTTSPPTSPSVAGSSPLNSPLALKNIAAPKFYKETLDTEEPKPTEEETTEQAKPKESEIESTNEIKSPDQVEEDDGPTENVVKEVNGVRGVLVYHKRKGPKKSVKWRQESELEEIQYFELDETERVNVTKTFMDMKQMEHVGEREALQLSRKLPNEDLMDERIPWKALIPLDLPAALAEPGKKSLEKDIQFAREKVILQALYFNRSMLPDSAAEPDPETHQMTDPITIPLDDVTGNPDSINDFQGTPWPEPKGSPPHPGPMSGGPPSLFSGIPPFTPQMGPPGGGGGGGGPGFPNIPPQNFNGPNFMPPPHLMGAGDWRPMGDGPIQPDNNHSGPIAPLFNNRQDNFNDNSPVGFPPQGFGPPGPMGPPGPGPGPGPMFPNFPNRGGNRGGFRNMGRGGWFRPAGPPPGWHGNRGGGGNHWGPGPGRGGGGGGICKQFKMHGYCRQRDTCPYMHPQNNAHNGPY